MRLLIIVVCAFSVFWTLLSFAGSDCNKVSSMTKDIFQCVNNLYEKVDRKLNEHYAAMVAVPGVPNKSLLMDGERAWIKYRDLHCDSVYESIMPGEEADIEKVACLVSLTSSRLSELIYLDTGASSDGFYNSLSTMSKISAKNRAEILSYIESLESYPEAVEYYEKNCKLAMIMYAEDERLCRARLKFQSM